VRSKPIKEELFRVERKTIQKHQDKAKAKANNQNQNQNLSIKTFINLTQMERVTTTTVSETEVPVAGTVLTGAPQPVVAAPIVGGARPVATSYGTGVVVDRRGDGEFLKDVAYADNESYVRPYEVGTGVPGALTRGAEASKKEKHKIRAEAEMAAAKDSRFGPAERVQAGIDAVGDKIKAALHPNRAGHTGDRY